LLLRNREATRDGGVSRFIRAAVPSNWTEKDSCCQQ
jgi:hypothetical protein